MTDSLKKGISTAVATATMLWSVGAASFVAPLTARAAMAGDVIRGTTLSTLYYQGNNGKRYAFPNEKTYLSWYADFSGVQTISDSQLAAIPLGGNVAYRPGARWIKISSDPKTYAVSANGSLRWIESESVASGLAGSDWNQFIDDVADVFFVDYTVGASLTSAASAYNGALVKMADGTYYVVQNGAKRKVTSAGFSANRLQSRLALDGSGVNLSAMTSGSDVTGKEAWLSDAAQLPEQAIGGGLSVSLASDSPAAMTVPSQAAGVSFMKFNLSSSGATTVNSITVKQGGVGSTTTVDTVYLYDGSTRLSNGRSLNSSTREAAFTGLNLSLSAGQTKTLTVVVDMADNATGGDTISFELVGASAIVGSSTVSGSFPVRGATMTTSATDVGTVTIEKNGTITNPTLGQDGAKIAEFKLTSGSSEGVKIQHVRVDVRDALDHENYKLYQNNTLVAVGTRTSADKVDFLFTNPFEIGQGNNKIFEVRADVGGQSSDTIKVALEEDADLKAVGMKYGFGVAVTRTAYDEPGSACAATSDDCSLSTIQGGKVTVAFNGPNKKNIKPDSSGVVIWEGAITSMNAVQIRDFDFLITGSDLGGNEGITGLENNYQSFRLINKATGATVAGPEEFDGGTLAHDDASEALSFIDDWNLSAGQTMDLQLIVDVKGTEGSPDANTTDVADADTITAMYYGAQTTARDGNNDDLLSTDIVPQGNLTGFSHEIDTAVLTTAISQPPSSNSHVKGSQNVDVVGLAFTAGSASSVTVSTITLNAYGDNDVTDNSGITDTFDLAADTYISSCTLYDGLSGTLIDGPESFGTTDAGSVTGTDRDVTFSGFNWTIPAGETKKVVARCNFANNLASSSSDSWALQLAETGDVTATDADGDTVSASAAVNVEGSVTVYQTITTSGSMTITIDGSTPKSDLVLGASTNVPVSIFKFQASTEAFTVTKLRLSNCLEMAVAANDACSGGAEVVGNDAVSAAVRISYKNEAGTTVTKTGFLSAGIVTFEGLDFYVPTTETRTLTVTMDTNTVSTLSGVTSGQSLQLNLVDSNFEAVGKGSGVTINTAGSNLTFTTGSNQTVIGNDLIIRKTRPTFSLASGSPSGAGVPGLNEVFRFNVSADSRGFIGLDILTFQVASTPAGANDWNDCDSGSLGAAANWDLYDAADMTAEIAGTWTFRDIATLDDVCDAANDLVFAELAFTATEQIGAGTTKTYSLKVNTLGAAPSTDDAIQISIPSETTVDVYSGTVAAIPQAVQWDDDVEGSNITNGTYIKNLPVIGGTIVY